MEKGKGKLGKRFLYLLLLLLLLFTFFLYLSLENGISNAKSDYTSEFEYKSYPSSIIFEGERFVHLDLKGAPPRISYYKDLFTLLSRLGATGILIEYEDMYPYAGELLKHIPAHNAYTQADIVTINSLAAENNLTVIPLVQTFGHLEFLLKLRKFSFLREVPTFPQVICPTHNMTLSILLEMIQQVIEAHPRSTMIHIGADEVYHIGKCDRCKEIMYEEKISKRQLFLSHIKRVAIHVKIKHPNIKILMWDDEFRAIDSDDLQRSAISLLVEPVIWKYSEDVYRDLGYELFNTYSKVFDTVWFASAFKGASGSNQYITPISQHIMNHQSWMTIYSDFKNKVSIHGIFITGWQRYDHFAVLCELLPIGIPSLAFSLSILLGFNTNGGLYGYPDVIVDVLNCKNPYALTETDSGFPYCKYPGGDILDAVTALHQFKKKYKSFKEQSRVVGWLSNYNIHYNYSNPDLVNSILESLTNLLSELTSIDTYLADTMLKVFDEYTVSEWQETSIIPVYDDINYMMASANRLLSVNEWPRRPW